MGFNFYAFLFLHLSVKIELCCMILLHVDYYDKECFFIFIFL